MANSDLREWLSLSPADLPVWLAGACCAGMFFARDMTLDVILAVAAVFLAVLACVLGMKHDEKLSRFTNLTKKITYPLVVVAVVAVVYVNFAIWNRLPPPATPGPRQEPPRRSSGIAPEATAGLNRCGGWTNAPIGYSRIRSPASQRP